VIDPTVDFRSSTRYAPSKSSVKDKATIFLADSAVQSRAYELYELRGKIDGRAEQDWYQAETDLRSQRQASVVDANIRRTSSKALRETHAA
jgi:hypothetical protein